MTQFTLSIALLTYFLELFFSVFRAMFKGPMAAAQQRRGSNDGSSDWTDDRTGSRTSSGDPADPAKSSKSRLELAGRHHRNTIAVGDVDGRAFDILLRSVKKKQL